MHEADNSRVADFKQEAKLKNTKLGDQFAGLSDDTHIITGTLEGNGATALASEKAKLSAKVIQLARTESGGIDYQVAIFVSEPTPVAVEPTPEPVDEKRVAAVKFFTDKGLSADAANKQVDQFGVARVLAARDKELDDQLAKAIAAPAK